MKLSWLLLFLLLAAAGIGAAFIENLAVMGVFIVVTILAGAVIAANTIRSARLNVELAGEKHRLDQIVANSADGIIAYTQDFNIVLFNKAAEGIFGISAAQATAKAIGPESVNDSSLQLLAQTIFPSLAPSVVSRSEENEYPQLIDISFENPQLELRVTTSRMLDGQGNVAGFLKIVRDRTREIGLMKSKSDFITVAAHQLRTPLSAINWAFEALAGEKLEASQKELVTTGTNAAQNLLKVVESLLSTSKIEEGKFGYDFQPIDLSAFLGELLGQAELTAREYNVNLYFDAPAETLEVTGDPEKLGMVVSNLLDNAIKYNVTNGKVVVSVRPVPGKPYVEVLVQDTGVGIAEDDLQKLFTKFYRGANAVNKETSGSGLGLYIVKNIIRRHGGSVWAESVLNRGTTFHFTLPTDPRLVPSKEIAYGE